MNLLLKLWFLSFSVRIHSLCLHFFRWKLVFRLLWRLFFVLLIYSLESRQLGSAIHSNNSYRVYFRFFVCSCVNTLVTGLSNHLLRCLKCIFDLILSQILKKLLITPVLFLSKLSVLLEVNLDGQFALYQVVWRRILRVTQAFQHHDCFLQLWVR